MVYLQNMIGSLIYSLLSLLIFRSNKVASAMTAVIYNASGITTLFSAAIQVFLCLECTLYLRKLSCSPLLKELLLKGIMMGPSLVMIIPPLSHTSRKRLLLSITIQMFTVLLPIIDRLGNLSFLRFLGWQPQ